MKKILIANWKMQLGAAESLVLAKKIAKAAGRWSLDISLAPDFASLSSLASILKRGSVSLAAQDCAPQDRGALTGEVSPANLYESGVKYVILGHSERRNYFGESSQLVNAKAAAALKNKLIPVICIGESLAEKEAGATKSVLSAQIRESLRGLNVKNNSGLVVAYEPLWAIGTGNAIVPFEAGLIHGFIKSVATKYIGRSVRVLYGGSVSSKNSAAFLAEKNIDGLLVGGASLKFEELKAIAA